jgi:hypothetical protein
VNRGNILLTVKQKRFAVRPPGDAKDRTGHFFLEDDLFSSRGFAVNNIQIEKNHLQK